MLLSKFEKPLELDKEHFKSLPLSIEPKQKALVNTVGKGENAGNQHFLLFPQRLRL